MVLLQRERPRLDFRHGDAWRAGAEKERHNDSVVDVDVSEA
jgi:hypothetical protein